MEERYFYGSNDVLQYKKYVIQDLIPTWFLYSRHFRMLILKISYTKYRIKIISIAHEGTKTTNKKSHLHGSPCHDITFEIRKVICIAESVASINFKASVHAGELIQ